MSCFFQITSAQNKTTVSGKVTDAKGESLVGISVLLKGTATASATDVNGQYSLPVQGDNAVLVFSYLGFTTQEIAVNGRTKIDITLTDDVKTLEQVVVTGYQSQRKKDLTGAVTVVDVDEARKQAVANPIKALQGQVPGMYITSSGSPSAPVTVRIRGIGTLNDNDPLYIIDGVPTKAGMHELNPADIESMQVLKDASAASSYGARAANGVIVITTKHAKGNGTAVNVNAYTALSSYLNKIEMLDAEQYGKVLWQASVNSGFDPNTNSIQYRYDWNVDPVTNQPVLSKVYVPEYLDAAHTIKSANTNWFDEISRLGVVQNYDAQVSNATPNGNYLFSLGYFDNKGIIKTTGFNRLSVRMNSDYKLFDGKFTIGENLSLTKTKEVQADIINAALQAVPLIPVHTADGIGWGGPVAGMNDRQNPVRVLEDNKQNGYNYMRLFGNFFAELKIINGLTFRSNFGIDYGNYNARNWQKKYVSGYLVNDVNKVINSQNHVVNTTWTNTLDYQLVKNNHRLNVTAGTEYVTSNTNFFNASREDYVLEDPDYMYLDAGTGIKDNSGYGAKNVLFSYLAKANYSYLDRYLISGTLRYDGSSRFGQNNKFGLFPAFSLGWRVSEEPFFKKITSVFDDLKLRYGFGITGNEQIANNAIYNIYLSNYNITSYDINGNKSGVLPSGFYLTQNANPDLKWESTKMSNIGLDYSLFNQKIYGSIDYYIKETSDILILPPYIGVLGEGGNRWVNGASMQNKGFEFMAGYRTSINNDWRLELVGNIATVKNKVTKLPNEVINAYGGDGRGQNILGRPFGSYFGYVADGLFRTQAEVDAHADQPGKGLGRIRYRDLDNNGVINDYDRTWIGVPIPNFTYGFNANITYKNFDLSFLLQGVGSVEVDNQAKRFTDFWSAVESSSNKGTRLLDAWSPSNPNSNIPAPALTDANFEARFSTYFIENGMYLKLRNAQLGYTFGQNALRKVRLKSVRVYVGGDNLAILLKSKSFTGLDPESAAFGYPNPTVFTGGVNVRF
ncbi:SusC/RagA family TonB-linked outer membrane protein [Mucilaginibacter limnophilus]|nr:TonB-dependent receptor [Mucilaginibacter limnophilus]